MVLHDVKIQIESCLLKLYSEDSRLKKYLIPNRDLQGKIFILQSLYKAFDWITISDFERYKELVDSLCICKLDDSISKNTLLYTSPVTFYEEEWVGLDYCCQRYEEEWIGSEPLCELI